MDLNPITPYCYEIPKSGRMNVPGRVFMSPRMADGLSETEALQQVANVASLPGIVNASLAMPDCGYSARKGCQASIASATLSLS